MTMNILADASLPGLETAFPAPFNLFKYTNPKEIPDLLANKDVLLCRSTLKINQQLIKNHQLNIIATASSGTDHIDKPLLKENNIQLFDAKGCNVDSVVDYISSCIAYLSQNKFLTNKKVGIIGMGMIGGAVSNWFIKAGFQVVPYDPLKAMEDPEFQNSDLNELFQVDILCIHASLHSSSLYPSADLLDETFLNQLKPGCIIINAARGGIVNERALLKCSNPLIYCTDVYLNEPKINKEIIEKATLCTPHIAGHSLEAKFAAVYLLSEQLHRLVGLPTPYFAAPEKQQSSIVQKNKAWDEYILSIYNPIEETLILKQSKDLESTFIELRKNHNQRHNFSIY